MQPPQQPDDEEQRLDALRALALVDTPPEERFDAVTRIARRLFDVPIALVTLIESQRQWFKSAQGLDIAETPRRDAFCGHTILSDTPLVVPDTRDDERFADNPLVTGKPWIRFYAGAPLVVNGHRLGSLCLLDHRPRSFSGEDQASIEDLAAIVAREMASAEMATVDQLTGLANRRGFIELARQGLQIAEREGLPMSLVFLDIDGLKAINDTHGHAAGDDAIRGVAQAMLKTFRAADIVGRLAGDEFVVLLHNTTAEQAPRSIQRLRDNLEPSHQDNRALARIVFSSGAVSYNPARHPDVESLIEEADSRMYQAKRSGSAGTTTAPLPTDPDGP